jgi:hypothetical protein
MSLHLIKSISALFLPVLLQAQVSSVKLTAHVPPPPPGKNVYVAGGFNAWKAGDSLYRMKKENDSTYSIVLPVYKNVKYQYKYTTGAWDRVELAANDSGIKNRSFISSGNKKKVRDTVSKWAIPKSAPEPSPQMVRINAMKDSLMAGLQPKLNDLQVLLKEYILNLLQANPSMETDNRITADINKRFSEFYGKINELFHKVFETMSAQQKQQIQKALTAPGAEKDFINSLGNAINEATK